MRTPRIPRYLSAMRASYGIASPVQRRSDANASCCRIRTVGCCIHTSTTPSPTCEILRPDLTLDLDDLAGMAGRDGVAIAVVGHVDRPACAHGDTGGLIQAVD